MFQDHHTIDMIDAAINPNVQQTPASPLRTMSDPDVEFELAILVPLVVAADVAVAIADFVADRVVDEALDAPPSSSSPAAGVYSMVMRLPLPPSSSRKSPVGSSPPLAAKNSGNVHEHTQIPEANFNLPVSVLTQYSASYSSITHVSLLLHVRSTLLVVVLFIFRMLSLIKSLPALIRSLDVDTKSLGSLSRSESPQPTELH